MRNGRALGLVLASVAMIATPAFAEKNICRCKYINSSSSGDGDCSLAENRNVCKCEFNDFDPLLIDRANLLLSARYGIPAEYPVSSLSLEEWRALSPEQFSFKMRAGLLVAFFRGEETSELAGTVLDAIDKSDISFTAEVISGNFLRSEGPVEEVRTGIFVGPGCISVSLEILSVDGEAMYKTFWSPIVGRCEP